MPQCGQQKGVRLESQRSSSNSKLFLYVLNKLSPFSGFELRSPDPEVDYIPMCHRAFEVGPRTRTQILFLSIRFSIIYHCGRNSYCQCCKNHSMIFDKSQSILKTICLVNEIWIYLGGWGTICGLAIGIMWTTAGWNLKKKICNISFKQNWLWLTSR